MVVSKRPKVTKSSYGSKTSKKPRKSSKKTGGMIKKTVVMPKTRKPKVVNVEIAVKQPKVKPVRKPVKKLSRSKTSKTSVCGKGYVAGRMVKRRSVARRPAKRTRIVRK